MVLAQDLTTVDGLPLHPLVVHAVVVLLPLAAVGATLIALRPAWRRRFGWPVLAMTVLGVASVPMATFSGDQLNAAMGGANPLIAEHSALASVLMPLAIGFGVAVLVLVLSGRVSDREPDPTDSRARVWRLASVAAAVLTVVLAVATTVQVVRTGHTGSTAVWEGRVPTGGS
ncbi:DUF2231 domain-containing protein [Allokutzneria albata]|uniref:DUF2231 domain-containing protein n=1 Tax=Allokutzneria albata TaxID=211114 RepID=A0A1G9XV72_ALLAB|nr:DUF2231 domain-containing protein [Allokutzneria albata]SDN00707.1 hypothetical protein SAMN04489726_4429 [Allokutzneria albata]